MISVFSFRRRKEAAPIPLLPFFRIQETMQGVTVNDSQVSFISLIPTSQTALLLSQLSSTIPEFSLEIGIYAHDHYAYRSHLEKKFRDKTEELLEIEKQGKLVHVLSLQKELKKLQNEIALLGNDPLIRTTSITVCTPGILSSRMLYMIGSLCHVTVVPLVFEQMKAFERFFLRNTAIDPRVSVRFHSHISPFSLFSPITSSSLYIAHEKKTGVMRWVDFFAHENYNAVIVAKSGAGKSFLAKQMISRLVYTGIKIIVIDFEGEYESLVSELHGQCIEEEDTGIFDSLLLNTVGRVYLEGLIAASVQKEKERERIVSNIPLEPSLWLEYCSSFSSSSSLGASKLNNDVIHIRLRSEEPVAALYRVMMYALYRDTGKTILVVDEAHRLLDHVQTATLVRQIAKRGRKYGLGMCIISQDITDFVENPWGKAVIANSTIKMILKQEPLMLPLINATFGLEGYDIFLSEAERGDGLLIVGKEVTEVHFDVL